MDQIKGVTVKMITFDEIKAAVKEVHGWKVITEDRSYFNVENDAGYRAYVQLDCYGYEYHNPRYYKTFELSTVHKPNKNAGSNVSHVQLSPTASIETIFEAIQRTLVQSQLNIQSGRVQMDTRKPSECGRFLQY